MPLNPQQQAAVEYLEGPLLVLAGPGTGKTQLLSSKVEHILKNTDTNPENILCLTFTENGAQNMRDRLFSMIGQAGGQVAIHTYHAFGSVVLAADKNYATNFDRNLDEPIDPVAQYKIVKNILESLDGTDILYGAKVRDVVDTIASAKSARLTAANLQNIAEDNIKIATELLPKIQAPLKNLVKNMKVPAALEQVYLPLAEVLAGYAKKEELAPGVVREVNEYLLELNALIEEQQAALAGTLDKKPSVQPLNKWKSRRFELDNNGDYRFTNVVANKKLLSLAHVMQQYDDKLAAEGWFDFSDMIEQAIKTLKEDEGFRLTLSERFQYILLDEFQDTNPSQAELIYLLTQYDKPVVMAVGDDDQAIFEFQGANASNLIDFQNHYDAKVITLTDNYRSTAEILQFARHIADQVESSFSKQRQIEKILRSINDKLLRPASDITQVERHEFVSADGEYYWVAEQIAELVKKGVKQSDIAIITPKHKYIAPLLPYLKSHPEINIAYEKRENLFEDPAISELLLLARFIYELSEEKQPTYRLLQILSFDFWGLDRVAVMQVAARDGAPTVIDRLASSPDPQIQALASYFSDLVALSYEAPLELFIDVLIGIRKTDDFQRPGGARQREPEGNSPVATTQRSERRRALARCLPSEAVSSQETGRVDPCSENHSFVNYYCKDDSSLFDFYEKLGSLKKASSSYLKNDQPKLKDLIAFLDDYESSSTPLTLTSPYQDSSNSVQILTAHKSKGLEFKYVFVIATDDLAWANAKGNNNTLVLPANLTKIRHTGTTDDECLRLFFVAVTRAKSYLYLTNSRTDFSGKTPARLKYLGEYEQDSQIISPFLDTDKIVQNHAADLDAAKKQTDLKLGWISAYVKYSADLKPQLLKNLERFTLSASDLTSFIDIVYAGPSEFFKKRILCADSEPATASALYGTLIHAAFERVTSQGFSDEATLAAFREDAEKLPLLPADRQALIDRGVHGLTVSLKTFGPILRTEHARAELDLRSEHLHFNQIPVGGIIDHLNINPKTKTIEVYDFKTGNYKEKKWDSDSTLYKYKLQLCFYKLLLQLSPEYANYKIERAHILFVTPDATDDAVHDKVYEYNDRDEAELKNLVAAVYAHIKTLDFLDRDDLMLLPDENRKLKDIKEFAQLLIDTAPELPKNSYYTS